MKLVLHLPEIDVARTISKILSIKTLVIQICKLFNKHNLEDNLVVKVSLEDNLEDNLDVQTISIQIVLLVARAILIIPTVLLEVQTISIQIVPLVVLTILIIPTVLLEAQIISDLVK